MAGRPLTNLSFEEWVEFTFDRPVRAGEKAWYRQDNDWFEPEPQQAVAYLTQLFERSGDLLEHFTDGEIGQGLWYLIDNGAGAHCAFLIDGSVPIEMRVACIEAMQPLYARLFQPRCAPVLSHLDEPGSGRTRRRSAQPGLLHVVGHHPALRQLETTQARSDTRNQSWRHARDAAPAQSRLPGKRSSRAGPLGTRVSGVYGSDHRCYLAANRTLRPELIRYAQAARSGCVN